MRTVKTVFMEDMVKSKMDKCIALTECAQVHSCMYPVQLTYIQLSIVKLVTIENLKLRTHRCLRCDFNDYSIESCNLLHSTESQLFPE